ncbi:sporulation protein [Lentzea tibetensis]|uniref:Sporulation protein n=1 Tax=Lentzea tibetensis TaxID=2591470 RepID=A0A563EM24_9PSEU|nr:sporulation protein [Lentzea tibetensis]TWP48207.1 sporulation protein [Lentzea tibetensis]
MFKRMLRAFGVGGPTVDTVLTNPNVRPGELLTGEVRIAGGDHPADIDHVTLSLMTKVEVESGDNEYNTNREFAKVAVAQRVQVAPGQRLALPFQFPVPLETPLNVVMGTQLAGMQMGLRTELEVRGAVDPGDLDPVWVHALPSQERVLQAFAQLGFRFTKADNEQGRLHGVPQQLPFYQEIEFYPPQQFMGRVNQVELTFVATPQALYTILEADKRGGMFRAGGDSFGHFHMSHEQAMGSDWAGIINNWMSQISGRGGHGMHGGHGGHGVHGHGMGIAGIAAAGAAGVAGGMIMGEVFDEIGDFFGD